MKLYNYYSLDECVDRKKVTTALKKYVKEGKIEYDLDKSTDVFQLDDLDLEEEDIDFLVNLFDENDVFPYLDKDDDQDDDDDYGYNDYYDDEEEY